MASTSTETNYQELEKLLDYRFQNRRLLSEALRHRSFVNENPHLAGQDNERLEFLGDAVLNLVVSHILIRKYPEMSEGDLSRTRAHLVNETRLAQEARSLMLGTYVQLGRGEAKTGGQEKPSILSDTLEAVLAAIYLDGGFQAAFDVINERLHFRFEALGKPAEIVDYKSRLQEYVQTREKTTPVYRIIEERGPDHDKEFVVELTLKRLTTLGTGKNKKAAEQEAAREALTHLCADD